MNSAMLLVILAVFQGFVVMGDTCPTSPSNGNLPIFLFLFGGLALIRDILDYRYAWRFVYPIAMGTAEALDRWPITKIREGGLWQTCSIWLGAIFVVLSLVLVIGTLRLWDFAYWTKVCKIV
jgi:hypothetical protein